MPIHPLFPNLVYLTEDEHHQYFDNEGKEYMSFSRCMKRFIGGEFNKEMIARQTAKRDGVNASDVLAGWDKRRDDGTKIDKALEVYAQTGTIPDDCSELEALLIPQVLSKYSKAYYNVCYEQVIVYSKEYRVAGSIDKTCIISNRSTSDFDLGDFKCFDDGMGYDYKGEKYLKAPFDYLINSKWNKITVQLSFYAVLLEKLTGRRCRRLFVDLIQPKKVDGKVVSYSNYVVPIQYLKPQIEQFLDMHKDMILDVLEPTVVAQTETIENEEWF